MTTLVGLVNGSNRLVEVLASRNEKVGMPLI